MSTANKAALRQSCRAYRQGLSGPDYRARCRSIASRLSTLPQLTSAEIVHVYWPHLRNREIDIRPIIAYLRARNQIILLPIVDFDAPDPRMHYGCLRLNAT